MGLAAPQRRNKISHDPNNTTWSKSTNTYGQKILSAQGWKPGDYLGAENASHGDHYTAANASHIRVLLREDNLGLGAQVGKTNAETFGLSLFSGVLGRLNGKSGAEIERQQGALRDAELRTYQSNKYGHMNFVSGGVLVGDMIEPSANQETGEGGKRSRKTEGGEEKEKAKKRRKEDEAARSKSRKSAERADGVHELHAPDKGERRKSRGQRSSLGRKGSNQDDDSDLSRTQHLESEHANSERDADVDSDEKKDVEKRETPACEEGTEKGSTSSVKPDRIRSKSERRARKEARRKRKEEKQRAKLSKDEEAAESTGNEMLPVETTKTPASLSQSNRHAVRRRYIEQKRMTSLNPQAMKEIFMLQATA